MADEISLKDTIRPIDKKKFDLIRKDVQRKDCSKAYKKRKLRGGIPSLYRSYIWLMAAGIPLEDGVESVMEHYRPRYNALLRTVFGGCNLKEIIISDDKIPSFSTQGANRTETLTCCRIFSLSKEAQSAAKRLFCVVSQLYPNIDCPILPSIICLLLHEIPEFLVPAIVGEMMKRSDFYVFMGYKERHQVVTNTYVQLMEEKVSSRQNIAEVLNIYAAGSNGNSPSLSPEAHILFEAMTKYFFRSVFPQHVVLQLFDAYMLEGRKILFRFTLSIMEECYKKLRNTKKSTGGNDNINLYALLNTLSDLRMMPNKTKNRISKRAYGYRLRRQQIKSYLKSNSKSSDIKFCQGDYSDAVKLIFGKAMISDSTDSSDTLGQHSTLFFRPKVFHGENDVTIHKGERASYLLSNKSEFLMDMYKYLPKSLQQNDLKILFRTSSDGYSLKNMLFAYYNFKGPTLLCIEPLTAEGERGKNPPDSEQIIGIFTPTTWFPETLAFPTLGSSVADAFIFYYDKGLTINRIHEDKVDELVSCTIENIGSRNTSPSTQDDHLIFGVDTKESLNMALRMDGDLKIGQSTSNNIFKGMEKSNLAHDGKEFLIKQVELYGFVYK